MVLRRQTTTAWSQIWDGGVGDKRRLTIRDIGVDDDGIYLCEMADGGRSIAEVAVKGKKKKKNINLIDFSLI